MPAHPPPHSLWDVANTGLLLGSCKSVPVPHDTGGRLECLCESSCVSETVGARMSLSLRALSLVSQAMVRLVTVPTSGCSGSSDGKGGCTSGAQPASGVCAPHESSFKVGPTLSCDLWLHRPRVVPSLLQSAAAAWWEEAAGMFSCIVGVRSCASASEWRG